MKYRCVYDALKNENKILLKMNNLQRDEAENNNNINYNNGADINENGSSLMHKTAEPRAIQQPQQNRRRMKWNKEINENIIRSYYQATLNIPDQPYRKEMTNS